MEIKLFPPEDEIGDTVFLKLGERHDKICLLACNRNGEAHKRGTLLTISVNGEINRPWGFNPKCKFKRNELGQVIIS